MTRIILRGYNGRMGRVITDLVNDDPDAKIVAGIDLFPGKADYPTFESYEGCDVDADVIIDFSSPKTLDEELAYAVEKKLPIVLCTTGFSQDDLKAILGASKSVPILRSGNMSLGINTMAKLLQTAAKILADEGFDIEVVEAHHNQKKDAPSGTALLLADSINEVCDNRYEYVYDRSGRRETRPENEIGISCVRGGSIVGEHTVIFAGLDEVIEIKHTAYSRAIFGKGAVSAAKFLNGKPAGMYSMKDVLA